MPGDACTLVSMLLPQRLTRKFLPLAYPGVLQHSGASYSIAHQNAVPLPLGLSDCSPSQSASVDCSLKWVRLNLPAASQNTETKYSYMILLSNDLGEDSFDANFLAVVWILFCRKIKVLLLIQKCWFKELSYSITVHHNSLEESSSFLESCHLGDIQPLPWGRQGASASIASIPKDFLCSISSPKKAEKKPFLSSHALLQTWKPIP